MAASRTASVDVGPAVARVPSTADDSAAAAAAASATAAGSGAEAGRSREGCDASVPCSRGVAAPARTHSKVSLLLEERKTH